MIDNKQPIMDLLEFDSPLSFYRIIILKRRKDFPKNHVDAPKKNSENLKIFTVNSLDFFGEQYEQVKDLCERNMARACVYVNPFNYREVAVDMINMLTEQLRGNYQIKNLDTIFAKTSPKKKDRKKWILDVDGNQDLEKLYFAIGNAKPTGSKTLSKLPTPNGVHIITKKFDKRVLSEFKWCENKKGDSPTLLYYPDSLEFIS